LPGLVRVGELPDVVDFHGSTRPQALHRPRWSRDSSSLRRMMAGQGTEAVEHVLGELVAAADEVRPLADSFFPGLGGRAG